MSIWEDCASGKEFGHLKLFKPTNCIGWRFGWSDITVCGLNHAVCMVGRMDSAVLRGSAERSI